MRDDELWEAEVEKEQAHRDQLQECATQWAEVTGYIENGENYLKMNNQEEASGTPAELKKQLLSLLCQGIEKSERTLTIFDEAGNYGVHVPLNEFAAMLKPTSIKTKKKNPPKS